jgi:2-hydroxychromene-2-carboxylate isomerase
VQAHLDFHDREKALETAIYTQSNQISALLRSLASIEQGMELVLDYAKSTYKRVQKVQDRQGLVDPEDVINYADKLSGQTSAPRLATNDHMMRSMKPLAYPDEAAIRSGVLFALGTGTVPAGSNIRTTVTGATGGIVGAGKSFYIFLICCPA